MGIRVEAFALWRFLGGCGDQQWRKAFEDSCWSFLELDYRLSFMHSASPTAFSRDTSPRLPDFHCFFCCRNPSSGSRLNQRTHLFLFSGLDVAYRQGQHHY
jgi:hypothetical protein